MDVRLSRLTFLVFCFLIFITPSLNAQSSYTVEGNVIDYDTKQPIKNISVTVKETKQGGVTNDSGYFRLTVARQTITLLFSAVGYVNHNQSVNLATINGPLKIELKRRADEMLDEVVVNSYQNSSNVKSADMNLVKINTELIKRSPLLLGEADIIKALLLQPGVTTVGEGAGGFNVRGGNADQNLVLVDEAPLFNTSHLLGFYTSVSPDAIQDVILYKGSMPAQYGGRLSSLLNMKTKTGNNNRMQYTGGISPMSGRFYLNGPVVKNKLTLVGGLRIAYPNLILNALPGNYGDSRAFFYDGLIKGEYTINDKNKISLTGYTSYDKFRFDTLTHYKWNTSLGSLNYLATFNDRLSCKLNANYSRFISEIESSEENYEYILRSSITHKEIKAIFTYKPDDKNKIEFGADGILYSIQPGDQRPTSLSSSINHLVLEKEHGRELAVFAGDEIDFSDRISVQAGIRYVHYDYLSPKKVYQYEEGLPLAKETITDTLYFSGTKSIQHYAGFEPRVSLRIGLSDDLSCKLSYNRGQQFLHLISNTTSISPVDFWKLSDRFINRQIGDQYAAGIFKNYKNNQYNASIELYYKTTKNMVEYKDGGRLLMNPYIETALLNSSGRAYGIELSLSKNSGKFTGTLNYTYSKTEVRVLTVFPAEQINNGDWYPSNYDRPHNLAIITRLKLGRGWSLNNNFVLVSGRAATYPDGNYSYNGTLVNNYSRRNHDRLPTYHRLDLGFSHTTRRTSEQKKYSVWNISFYNIYMHKNAYSIFFKRSRDDRFFARENDRLVAYQLSVIGTIIPSITWNYYF